jgi:exopolysaccharide production protein ExoY
MSAHLPSAIQVTSSIATADGFVGEGRHTAQAIPVPRLRMAAVGGIGKRLFDVSLASAALIVLMPLMLGVALLVRLSGPGPVLFGHERIGFAGQRFRCLKFRTMVVDAERVLEEHFLRYPAERAVWLAERKLTDDPRITPVGTVLRKLSVDELPQLINILLGQMSVVGPRPVVADELRNYRGSATHYLRTRPGLTGLWQVSGRNDTSYARRVLLDRVYVRRWSLGLDLAIIGRTVPAVLMSRGAR